MSSMVPEMPLAAMLLAMPAGSDPPGSDQV
jgi:hypothetical protein